MNINQSKMYEVLDIFRNRLKRSPDCLRTLNKLGIQTRKSNCEMRDSLDIFMDACNKLQYISNLTRPNLTETENNKILLMDSSQNLVGRRYMNWFLYGFILEKEM